MLIPVWYEAVRVHRVFHNSRYFFEFFGKFGENLGSDTVLFATFQYTGLVIIKSENEFSKIVVRVTSFLTKVAWTKKKKFFL